MDKIDAVCLTISIFLMVFIIFSLGCWAGDSIEGEKIQEIKECIEKTQDIDWCFEKFVE